MFKRNHQNKVLPLRFS